MSNTNETISKRQVNKLIKSLNKEVKKAGFNKLLFSLAEHNPALKGKT